jgi:magnesium-transporting ATPase (P-type)
MFEMLLGHLVGDYLLQNNWMALGKSKHNGLGWFTCTVHCILYAIAVCAVMGAWSVSWFGIVFASHFVIDKFGIAEHYLVLIRGRSLQQYLDNEENKIWSPYIGLRGGFYIFVYVVVDNTMHLLLMYGAWNLLYGGV